MSDSQINPGGLAITSATRVATDQSTVLGDGSSESPLHVPAGSVAVETDGTLTGNGTTGAPLHVAGGGGAAYATFLPTSWYSKSSDEDGQMVPWMQTPSHGAKPDGVYMPRAGSIVGMSSFLSRAITGGDSLVFAVTINGVAQSLEIDQDAGTQPIIGVATATPGDVPYAAGDLIGVTCSTSGSFALLSDRYVWVEVVEQAS